MSITRKKVEKMFDMVNVELPHSIIDRVIFSVRDEVADYLSIFNEEIALGEHFNRKHDV